MPVRWHSATGPSAEPPVSIEYSVCTCRWANDRRRLLPCARTGLPPLSTPPQHAAACPARADQPPWLPRGAGTLVCSDPGEATAAALAGTRVFRRSRASPVPPTLSPERAGWRGLRRRVVKPSFGPVLLRPGGRRGLSPRAEHREGAGQVGGVGAGETPSGGARRVRESEPHRVQPLLVRPSRAASTGSRRTAGHPRRGARSLSCAP